MPIPPNVKPFSVTALNTSVKGRLEEFYPSVWVAGEVANYVRASSGHLYFTLKDAQSSVRCCMWRAFGMRLRFDPHDGMEVIVRGGLTVFPPRGDYQLIIEELQPKGIGAAELALRQLKEKLFQRGYFDPKRKRPLPRYPRCIGLIASPTGAAIRDMLEILAKRWPMADAIVRPSRVQGEGAAQDLAAAVRQLSTLHRTHRLTLDAVVLGRGGGSAEDLAAFNEEIVADAIHACSVPVVSAVGHEIDVSIADLVADYRALTPSQAITALCPDHGELAEEMIAFSDRLRDTVLRRIELGRQRLDKLTERATFRRPLDRIRDLDQRLDERSTRLQRAMLQRIRRANDQLAGLADQLEGLSPLNVLKRGYSLTQLAGSERLIRDATTVQPGERLVTRVERGEIVSRVEEVRPDQPGSREEL
ncbi:MAG: exodeoxyribonuclease VII large subunit [Bacteroidales bacterium]|nr:exodeoxyribonuclease VII large subunit [Bacteroidales bacterium]